MKLARPAALSISISWELRLTFGSATTRTFNASIRPIASAMVSATFKFWGKKEPPRVRFPRTMIFRTLPHRDQGRVLRSPVATRRSAFANNIARQRPANARRTVDNLFRRSPRPGQNETALSASLRAPDFCFQGGIRERANRGQYDRCSFFEEGRHALPNGSIWLAASTTISGACRIRSETLRTQAIPAVAGIGLRVSTVTAGGVPDADSSPAATSLPIAPNPIPANCAEPDKSYPAPDRGHPGSRDPVRPRSSARRDVCRARRQHSPWSRADPGPA